MKRQDQLRRKDVVSLFVIIIIFPLFFLVYFVSCRQRQSVPIDSYCCVAGWRHVLWGVIRFVYKRPRIAARLGTVRWIWFDGSRCSLVPITGPASCAFPRRPLETSSAADYCAVVQESGKQTDEQTHQDVALIHRQLNQITAVKAAASCFKQVCSIGRWHWRCL